jgi:hypothetical protein
LRPITGFRGKLTGNARLTDLVRHRAPEVLIWEALGGHPPVTPQGSERPIAVTEPTKNRSTSP